MTPKLVKIDGSIANALPANGTNFTLEEMYKLIGCDCIQIVRTAQEGVIMVIDDNGLMNGKAPNIVATKLYPFGNMIVGDVLVCPTAMVR